MSEARHFRFHAGQPETNKGVWRNFTAHLQAERDRLFAAGQDLEVTVKPYKAKRSLSQNRLYWWWLKQIADHINASQGTAFSDEDIHDWMRERFLESQVIEIDATPARARKSTTKLTVQQMTEYLENVDWFANERLGLVLPHPEDLYREAMGHGKAA